jgi:hypothetical protein
MSELENVPTGGTAGRLGKATTSTDVNDPEDSLSARAGGEGADPGPGSDPPPADRA